MNSIRPGHQYGFTIVEVMLFLAVSGALAVAVLATSGMAINQQRYKDAVNTFKTLVAQQYNEVAHVVNDRVDSKKCDSAAAISDGAEARGTSECVILGRYITLGGTFTDAVDHPQNYAMSNVIGYGVASDELSDIDALQSYTLSFDSDQQETGEFAWGTKVANPTSILILRSPVGGTMLTFVSGRTSPSDVGSLITTANMNAKDICLNPDGLVLTPTLGIGIKARAAGPSAVETLMDGVC